jgi:hypothetical protein
MTNGIPEHREVVGALYPNPLAKDKILTLELKEQIPSCVIYDILGMPVFIQNIKNMQPQLDLSGLQPGVYWLKPEGGAFAPQKIIIQE